MAAGDPLYGIPSSGIHSNGLSLARKAVPESDAESWRELLVPTSIYVRELMHLHAADVISAAAHITGGGLEGNLVRVLASGLVPRFTWDWKVPRIFSVIRESGNIREDEMRKVFNLGVGVALVVPKSREREFLLSAQEGGIPVFGIGELVRG
jgi:phosphoribosylformylglycinamidine cyclo-ligase